MSRLKDIIAYFCKYYPHKGELSNARLTKMIYLADWKSALDRDRQITDIDWRFDNYGPFVRDVLRTAENDPIFEVKETINEYFQPKTLIRLKKDTIQLSLAADEKKILDFVIDSTKNFDWDQFIQLVYSTYPIMTRSRYSYLNLRKLARECKKS